jgi:predicted small metal-binding protein
MMMVLKKLSCDPSCGFEIQSHDAAEIKKFAAEHAKKSHKMTVTGKQLEGMIMTVKK